MTSESARLVVYLGSMVGFVIWIWGLLRARAMLGSGAEPDTELARVEVDGTTEEVSREIGRTITGQAGSMLGGFRIEDVSSEAVRLCGLSSVPFFNRLRARFTLRAVEQNKTEVTLTHNRGAVRRGAAVSQAMSLLLGLPILVGLAALLLYLVVDATQAGTRSQAFQIVQAVHVLWPPFLLQFVGRRTQRLADESLEQIVARLRFR